MYIMWSNTYSKLATGILGNWYQKSVIILTSYIDVNIVDIKDVNYNSIILTDTNKGYTPG